MLIDYIEITGTNRIWKSSLDAWRFHEVYGQKCGYEDKDSVWSNDVNNVAMVF